MASKANKTAPVKKEERMETLFLDDLPVAEVKALELDQEITVVIKGRVESIAQDKGNEYGLCCDSHERESKKITGRLRVMYKKENISIKGGNEFANLVKEDE